METKKLTEEHRIYLKSIGDYFASLATGGDPVDVAKTLAALGDQGLLDGGYADGAVEAGLDRIFERIFYGELARARDIPLAATIIAHERIALPIIDQFGSVTLRERFLDRISSGKAVAAVSFAPSGIVCRSTDAGTILSGTTGAVVGAACAGLFIIALPLDPDSHPKVSLVLIPADHPGLTIEGSESFDGRLTGTIGLLRFADCVIPDEFIIGALGAGERILADILPGARLARAAFLATLAQICVGEAIAYAGMRTAFGKPIGKFQVTKHRLVDMTAAAESAFALVDTVYRRFALDLDVDALSAATLISATESASFCADRAVQVFGGNGYMDEQFVSRAYRYLPFFASAGEAEAEQEQAAARCDSDTFTSISMLRKPEYQPLRDKIRKFITAEILPSVDQWEKDCLFPDDVFRKFGQAGLLGMQFDPTLGGKGASVEEMCVFIEELALCESMGLDAGIIMHSLVILGAVEKYGNAEQKERFLRPGIQGTVIGALGLTEPNTGSDLANVKTHATDMGDHFLLDGAKIFITNGIRADFVLALVRTDPATGYDGFTTLIVEKGMPGFTVSRKLVKLGWWCSDTAELSFDGVKVPKANVLGQVGQGFYNAMGNLEWERLILAVGSIAGMVQLFERIKALHSSDPKYTATCARLAAKLAATEAYVEYTLSLYIDGTPCLREVAMAKILSSELSNVFGTFALSLEGLDGYRATNTSYRFFRDVRLGNIGGGTTEIMKEVAARFIGL